MEPQDDASFQASKTVALCLMAGLIGAGASAMLSSYQGRADGGKLVALAWLLIAGFIAVVVGIAMALVKRSRRAGTRVALIAASFVAGLWGVLLITLKL